MPLAGEEGGLFSLQSGLGLQGKGKLTKSLEPKGYNEAKSSSPAKVSAVALGEAPSIGEQHRHGTQWGQEACPPPAVLDLGEVHQQIRPFGSGLSSLFLITACIVVSP